MIYTVDEVLERINKSRRKKLVSFLRDFVRYEDEAGVDITLPESPRSDTGDLMLVLRAPNRYQPGQVAIYAVYDRIFREEENFCTFYRDRAALLDFLGAEPAPAAPVKIRRESTGRPVLYGEESAATVQRLRAEGESIRGIAAALGMSTATVQKLIKRGTK